MSMDVMSHIVAPPATPSDPVMKLPSYFRHAEYSYLIVSHIVVMAVAWVFVLPVAVMFAISRSRHSFRTQLIFLLMNTSGVVMSMIYNNKSPDLYPHNVHHLLGWLLTCLAFAQAVMAWAPSYTSGRGGKTVSKEMTGFLPLSVQVLAEHQQSEDVNRENDYPYSTDSDHETEVNGNSSRTNSMSSSDSNDTLVPIPLQADPDTDEEVRTSTRSAKYLTRKFQLFRSSRPYKALLFLHEILIRLMLILGFAALITGVVTYAGIFRASHVFSGLAHFIKGGVFFWYGILTLGRWAGCFSDRGWAWNINPAKNSRLSAEFVESFLIFFYGSTNVFLEHLGSWGKAWTGQDLEHVSITIMFFGGGLCGMLIESSKVRDVLNATTLQLGLEHTSASYSYESTEVTAWKPPKSYKVAMNPIPALIILLLGMMMSSHHQESMVATMIHAQWGTLLMGAAFARVATYILYYLSPPTSFLPGRPPTEIITAFCLMAGGAIFMASSSDTVEAMEYNNLDAMFVFTVAMGIITFLMAWIILVIAIKGWAIKKECRSTPSMHFA